MSNAAVDFTQQEIQHMLDNIDEFSPDEVVEIERLVDELDKRRTVKAAYDDLIEFCKLMMPDFIVGKHHRILADLLMDIELGEQG